MKTNRLVYIVSTLLLSIALCGCGIKPDQLQAPEGYEDDIYPRTYPASPGETRDE